MEDPTLGEVYRTVLDMKREHGEDLREIKVQTKLTNGRVNGHDRAIAVLRWAMGLVGLGLLSALGVFLEKALR